MAEYDLPFPQYRCPTCNKELPLGEAHMTVTCGEHVEKRQVEYTVRPATDGDRTAIEAICDAALGETEVDVWGRTFDVLSSTNLVAESAGELVGLLSMTVDAGEVAVVLLSVYPDYQGKGVGSALLDTAGQWAAKRGLPLMRAAVTNDDLPLLYFLMRHGFTIYEVAVGEIADKLGSAVPGFSGIPVRDEIRLRSCV
ncbi:MAG: GNAT family N-acetyltransferase [Actinobacteria bacterium]|nr:MAG: GNAT family N-acetyltransferase [Actinomycetota bacterium]